MGEGRRLRLEQKELLRPLAEYQLPALPPLRKAGPSRADAEFQASFSQMPQDSPVEPYRPQEVGHGVWGIWDGKEICIQKGESLGKLGPGPKSNQSS